MDDLPARVGQMLKTADLFLELELRKFCGQQSGLDQGSNNVSFIVSWKKRVKAAKKSSATYSPLSDPGKSFMILCRWQGLRARPFSIQAFALLWRNFTFLLLGAQRAQHRAWNFRGRFGGAPSEEGPKGFRGQEQGHRRQEGARSEEGTWRQEGTRLGKGWSFASFVTSDDSSAIHTRLVAVVAILVVTGFPNVVMWLRVQKAETLRRTTAPK